MVKHELPNGGDFGQAFEIGLFEVDDVESKPANLAVGEGAPGVFERKYVASARINDPGLAGALGPKVRVGIAGCFGRQWKVKADDVRFGLDLGQACLALEFAAVRVVGQNAQSDSAQQPGERGASVAVADDSDGGAGKFPAGVAATVPLAVGDFAGRPGYAFGEAQ